MRRTPLLLSLIIALGARAAWDKEPPVPTATWTSPTTAVISWQQPPDERQTCLFRNDYLVNCWTNLPSGPSSVDMPGGALRDGAMHPDAGDRYCLVTDGGQSCATLGARPTTARAIYLPLITSR